MGSSGFYYIKQRRLKMNNDYVVHEEEKDGLTIKIIQDSDIESPINNWDMVGKQVYWHRRYTLGHCYKETSKYNPEEWFERELELNVEYNLYERWEEKHSKEMGYLPFLWKEFEKENLVIPVSAYEHGGITISASGKRAGWDSFDSGQLGFVYVSHEDIKKELGCKRITKKSLERAREILVAEVETYDDYLNNNVWGFRIENENGEHLDSCFGFIGDWKEAGVLEEAKSSLKWHLEEREKENKILDKRMLNELV